MSVLLFFMNIDAWLLCKAELLRFKFDNSVNLKKPKIERKAQLFARKIY